MNLSLRYRSLMVLVAVLFGQLLLMAYQLRRNQDIPLVRGSVVYMVGPFQRAGNAAVGAVRGVWDGYIYLWSTRRQNQTLQGKLEALTVENQRLREQAAEGQRLQVLLDLRQQVPLPTLAAQVLSTGSSETARIVLIDKGANAGLKPDFPVMVYDGVVGKVLHVFPDSSQVLLLTDPYSGVACLIEGSRAHGILKGMNRPLTSLWYVPNGEDVKAGQRVLTSGEDQIYPKGLPVGVVVEARPGPDSMQVTVQPMAPLNHLEDVLVILRSGGDVSGSPIASRNATPQAPQTGPQPAAAASAAQSPQTASSSAPAAGAAASSNAPTASRVPEVAASNAGSAPAGTPAVPAPKPTTAPAPNSPSPLSASAPQQSANPAAPKPSVPKPEAAAQPAAPTTMQATTPPRTSPPSVPSQTSPTTTPSPKPATPTNGITQVPANP